MPIGPVNPVPSNVPISAGAAPSMQDRLARLARIFPAAPENDGLSGTMPGTFERIESGLPQFDQASVAHTPIPLGHMMTPSQRASQSAPGPGAIGGGIETSLPFSAQIGLSAGQGQAQAVKPGAPPSSMGPTSSSPSSLVIANMLQQLAPFGPQMERNVNTGNPTERDWSMSQGDINAGNYGS